MNASPVEVQKALSGVDYPAARSDLISHAEEAGASEEVIAELDGLEEDEYRSPAAVMAALGEDDELLEEDYEEEEDYEQE